MGLTLHFELRLPPDTSRADAATMLHRLRDAAAATAVEHVSPERQRLDLLLRDLPRHDEAVRRVVVLQRQALTVDSNRAFAANRARRHGPRGAELQDENGDDRDDDHAHERATESALSEHESGVGVALVAPGMGGQKDR